MNRINILDDKVAQLIAAGEVIERPASVVKELVENSIDANSTKISIEVKESGTKYIKIADNGEGIFRDDIPKAFLRHATSKLFDENNLNSIKTLGFRGEALTSIAAVSQVELITRCKEESVGTRYLINSNENGKILDVGCTVGTTFIIKNLFFNTPVRMKFLKNNVAETNAIASIVDKIALSHPEISFKFIRNGKETLNTDGSGQISSCVFSVFGKEFLNGLIPVNYELQNVKIKGFVSRPIFSRANRNMQHFFVNKRVVKLRFAGAALDEAFKNSNMSSKFPSCIIYIEVAPEITDVNVHPAKTEIKFIHERLIFQIIYYGVKSALMQFDEKQTADFSTLNNSNIEKSENSNTFCEKTSKNNEIISENLFDKLANYSEIKNNALSFSPNYPIFDSNEQTFEKIAELKNECASKINLNFENTFDTLAAQNKPEQKKIKILGEIFSTYIVGQYGTAEMILIDKHAAHERLIFEKLIKFNSKVESQILMQPITVTLEKLEYFEILKNIDLIKKVGFKIEDFGSGMIRVRGIPIFLEISDVIGEITEISEYLAKNKKNINTNRLNWIYQNIACRSAINAGKSLSYEEIICLINDLENNPAILYCPHGRPIYTILKKEYFEKQFCRT